MSEKLECHEAMYDSFFSFDYALKLIKQGKKVTHQDFINKNSYIALSPSREVIWDENREEDFIIRNSQLLSKRWTLFEK